MSRAKRASPKPRARRRPASRGSSQGKAETPTRATTPAPMPAPTPAPPLAELRRQATKRLRGIARLRALVEREYLAAEEECDRLRAARPEEAILSETRSVGFDGSQGGEAGGAAEMGPRVSLRLEALQARLREAHAALEAAEARSRALQSRVLALEAQRATSETAPAGSGGRMGTPRADAAALRAELRRARADSDGLRENMTSLLGFLEELGGILSPSQETAETTAGT